MRRTQIYLEEEIYSYLKRESKLRGKTISELVREAIREKLNRRKEKLLRSLESAAGIWKDRKIEPSEFLRGIREDRNW
jgi:metal-responsive CopG/Arc/MetJ family transcriptional regulator